MVDSAQQGSFQVAAEDRVDEDSTHLQYRTPTGPPIPSQASETARLHSDSQDGAPLPA